MQKSSVFAQMALKGKDNASPHLYNRVSEMYCTIYTKWKFSAQKKVVFLYHYFKEFHPYFRKI